MKESKVMTDVLFEIDHHIDSLVKQIELLNYVNHVNIKAEKQTFLSFFVIYSRVFRRAPRKKQLRG